jgi:predicted DsbA family dithiol-disulfide isomerase
LHPETPEQGRTLDDLFAGRGVDIPQMLMHLKRTAHDLGLPFGERTTTFNSRRAQELGKWAQDQGRAEAFHKEMFRTYFSQGRNIADIRVLKAVASACGLDSDEAEAVLHQGRYQEAVDQDWQRSRQMGITAVPSFHMQGRVLVGAQTFAVLENWVIENSVASKPT